MPHRAVAQAFIAFLLARDAAGEIPNRAELAGYLGKSRSWLTMVLEYEEGAIDVDTAFRIAAWFDTTPDAIAEGVAPPRITRADERPMFEVWSRIPEDRRPHAIEVLRTFARRAQQPPVVAAAEPRARAADPKGKPSREKRKGA